MDYTEVNFHIHPFYPGSEVLMALLSEIGYESFEESENILKAYIPLKKFRATEIEQIIHSIAHDFKVEFNHSEIKDQNWNEVWEKSYEPVMIRDEIYIRAPFHELKEGFRFQLLIEPKMSFGTAHHETTYLMMEFMLEAKFAGSNVLDMGCGTGILSILAEMLGAKKILAIDNDENAYENTLENIRKNNCKNIHVLLGDAGIIKDKFQVILANINKNILLNDMAAYADHLMKDGDLFVSGFYEDDLSDIEKEAVLHGMELKKTMNRNNWIAARFIKK